MYTFIKSPRIHIGLPSAYSLEPSGKGQIGSDDFIPFAEERA